MTDSATAGRFQSQRADRMQRGGWVEADDHVQLVVAQDVQVRRRPQTAVHVASSGDLDRLVEARDRARRRHGVGEVRHRGVLPAERHATAVRGEGRSLYVGTTRNGVASNDFPAFPASITFK